MFGLSGSRMSCGTGGTGREGSDKSFVMERGGERRTHDYQGILSPQHPIVFQRH